MSKRSYAYKKSYPKQKWSINMVRIVTSASADVASNAFGIRQEPIVSNPSRINSAGSLQSTNNAAILKVGRVKFKGIIQNVASAAVKFFVFIAYVPEGYTSTTSTALSDMGLTLPYQHPEWLLAWTEKDYANAAQSNEISLSSNLKRNLNPGDKLVLGFIIINQSSATVAAANTKLEGNVQFVCRNN